MNIHHIAIYVQDLEGAREFFTRYFGATAGPGYHNRKTDFRSYFLTFSQGAQIELMHRPGLAGPGSIAPATGYAHLAIALGSKEQVDTLTARLAADGYRTLSGPRTTGDGYYESCIAAFEDLTIELTV